MPQPVTSPITSTPAQPGQPYDAVDNGESSAPWVKLPGGPASINTGRLSSSGDAEGWGSDGVWQQT